MEIKKGDIVGRLSYNKDIFFIIDRILNTKNNSLIAVLKGLNIRIEADAPIEDLEIIEKNVVNDNRKQYDKYLYKRIENNINKKEIENNKYKRQKIYTGRILHLDGDRKYSEKSQRYYNKIGLNAIVKNIPENKQASLIFSLLNKYNPDILIITGHDAMLKNGTNYNNIYNYRNSRHFINAVKEARKWGKSSDKLVIFAGACQSFYEAIMEAGADFASSPGRILIDFIDPLIVAEKVAMTDNHKVITSNDIAKEIKEGVKGIGGTVVRGKKKITT